jgi:hypothetical protein
MNLSCNNFHSNFNIWYCTYVCWLCSRFTENRSSWSWRWTPSRGGSVTPAPPNDHEWMPELQVSTGSKGVRDPCVGVGERREQRGILRSGEQITARGQQRSPARAPCGRHLPIRFFSLLSSPSIHLAARFSSTTLNFWSCTGSCKFVNLLLILIHNQ